MQVTAIFGSSLEVMISVHGEDPQVLETQDMIRCLLHIAHKHVLA